jgi:hypothetical protein
LVVTKASKRATLPFSKNLLIVDGTPLTLPGIVVYADKLEHAFGPIKAVELMR